MVKFITAFAFDKVQNSVLDLLPVPFGSFPLAGASLCFTLWWSFSLSTLWPVSCSIDLSPLSMAVDDNTIFVHD